MARNVFYEATVNFDHQILNQFILKSKWKFVPNLEKFLQGTPQDIAFTRTRWTSRKLYKNKITLCEVDPNKH